MATSQAAGVREYRLPSGTVVWASSNCSPCNTVIVQMQQQLIALAARLSIQSSTGVDGRVGPGTVATLKAVAQRLGQLGTYDTAQKIAQNADIISAALQRSLAAVPPQSGGSTTVIPGPGSTTMTVTPPPGGTTAPPPPPPPPPDGRKPSKIPKAYLIGGGIFLVGVIAAGVILTMPPKG